MNAYGLLWGLLLALLSTAAQAQNDTPPQSGIWIPNPGADLWKAVRQRGQPEPSTTQVQGLDSNQLINVAGEKFRDWRRERFIRYAAYLLAGVPVVILLFHMLHGAMKLEPSGRKLLRFDLYDRVAHWLLATVFLFLAFTGLLLLFGRFVIVPWLGLDAFSPIASASKEGHNLFGPLFLVALLWVFLRFVARNLPAWRDIVWLLKGGGAFGGKHPSAGFFNGGEKLWFWSLAVFGLLLSLSGLLLDFPSYAPSRELLVLALVVHGAAAVILVAFSFGHIYMGTAGVEGTLEGMRDGTVDANWARQHHDQWYAEMVREGRLEALSEAQENRAETTTGQLEEGRT